MIRICFHGAESTGKSVLAERLSAELRLPWVPEYGRTYAEQHGTQFSIADLLAIAAGHEAQVQVLADSGAALALLDTDPLMTAVWAQMLFDPDVPWIKDGTRLFGSTAERARFAGLAEAVLEQTGVPFERISGSWAEREARARKIIAGLT